MSIATYVGTEGFAVNVESAEELYEALDALHTQVMDNLPEGGSVPLGELLAVLEAAMEKLADLGVET